MSTIILYRTVILYDGGEMIYSGLLIEETVGVYKGVIRDVCCGVSEVVFDVDGRNICPSLQ